MDDTRQKWRTSFQRNRRERRLALSPEERRELVRRERERFVAGARKGWATRRANLGLDGPAERTVAVRVFAEDAERLRQLHPDIKRAVRELLLQDADCVGCGADSSAFAGEGAQGQGREATRPWTGLWRGSAWIAKQT